MTNKDDNLVVMTDPNYIRKSSSLVTEALNKGCDVIQMANGDIYITETKTVTFHYKWDEEKGRMLRVNSGGRIKKVRQRSTDILDDNELVDDLRNQMA